MKILLVSYYFTWSSSVGSRRTGGLARALAADGHDVTVVGAAPPDGRRIDPPADLNVVETAPRDRVLSARIALSRLGRSSRPVTAPTLGPAATPSAWPARSAARVEIRRWASFPDTMWEWHRTAERAVRSDLRPNLIIASAPPMASLRAASKLSAHFDCPWIADMRDLWTGDPNRQVPPILGRIDRALERSTLSSASAITTVADALAADLRQVAPTVPITVLRNGFDDGWLRTDDEPPACDAPIVFTGTLTANTGRNIDAVCEIGARLLTARRAGDSVPDIEVYGAVDPSIPRLVDERSLGEIIRLHGVVGADEIRSAQHGAVALLNLSWESAQDATNLPAKLFEYAAARRPVLHIGRVETLGTQLVRDHRLGFVCDPSDVTGVVDLIIQIAAGTSGWTPPEPSALGPLSQATMIDGFRRVIATATH